MASGGKAGTGEHDSCRQDSETSNSGRRMPIQLAIHMATPLERRPDGCARIEHAAERQMVYQIMLSSISMNRQLLAELTLHLAISIGVNRAARCAEMGRRERFRRAIRPCRGHHSPVVHRVRARCALRYDSGVTLSSDPGPSTDRFTTI